MSLLEKNNLINILRNIDFTKINLLGICLGMQLLLENSEEDGFCDGLGLIKGSVEKIKLNDNDKKNNLKIPNIGWKKIQFTSSKSKYDILNNQYFYIFCKMYQCEISFY